MTKVIIVDETDQAIGLKERDMWDDGDIHRVAALWLTNSKGEYLLARRALQKKHGPGLWATAAAGTVDEGETYVSNIIKETDEEIGLTITEEQLTVGPKILVGNSKNRRFIQWFFATLDIPLETLRFQPEEVMDATWVSPEKLREWRSLRPDELARTIDPILDLLLK